MRATRALALLGCLASIASAPACQDDTFGGASNDSPSTTYGDDLFNWAIHFGVVVQ